MNKTLNVGRLMALMLMIFMIITPMLHAAGCSPERARKVAYNFCVAHGHGHIDGGADGLISASDKLGFNDLYIFNLPEDGGFVIVAGDDCLHPIIGYGFESSLSNVGDNMRSWLENCERLVRIARNG